MPKKLTLNIDDKLISFAHTYSKQNGLSISRLFEQYLTRLQTTNQNQDFNPKTNNLYGIFQDLPIPDKKILREQFNEKNTH